MTKLSVTVRTEIGEEQLAYLESCCRIRGITINRLITRIMQVASRDQLVGSILDDEDHLRKLWPGESNTYPLHRDMGLSPRAPRDTRA